MLFKLTICRCNLTITNRRNRIVTDSIEAVECMHWWIKDGIADNVKLSGKVEEEVLLNQRTEENDPHSSVELIEVIMTDIAMEFE